MIGAFVREHDVWQGGGENLSRQPLKASAIAALRERAQTRRHGLVSCRNEEDPHDVDNL
jgi:hypothetical protein